MKISIRLIAVGVIGLLAVAACGQKGPLFLPGNPSEMRPQPPQENEDQKEEEDEEDEIAERPR